MTLATWECSWLVDIGYTEDGDRVIRDCGAPAAERADGSGWDCQAGHEHNTYGGPRHTEYLDDDEIAGIRHAGLAMPPNAARMDGSPL